ncbi:hypothetical protein FJT64_024497 [Amphibalanus amphitrite]|uniref:Uncharacterized protein n=1 Tax=Amphibalanus amphitrite TaxID=1232801 RepID=A0A6A4WNI1_AMPAM|nr:hypothetical protein FJT64_024497 [Amphibalanus amphitrite]
MGSHLASGMLSQGMAYYMEELGVDLDLVGGDRVAWLARIRQLEDRVQRLETEAGRVGEITSDGVPWFCRSEETGGGGGTQAAGPATALVHSLPLARGLEAAEPTDGGGGVMIVPGSPLPAAGYGRPLVMDRRGAPKPPSPDWTDVAGGMQIPGSAGAPRLCRPDEVDGRGGAQGPGPAAALAQSLPLARDLAAAEPTDGGDYLWGIPGSAAVPLPTAGYSPPPIVDAQSAWKRTAAYDLDRRLSSLARPRVGFFSVGRSLCVMGRRDEEGKRQHWVNEDRGYFSADGVHLTHLGRRRVLSGLPSWLAELRQPSE